MVESRQDARLAQEASSRGRAQALAPGDGLEGDLALEGLVEAEIHVAHAAGAEDVEITLESGVPHEVTKRRVTEIVVLAEHDFVADAVYCYTLKTTAGSFDPRITNRSG